MKWYDSLIRKIENNGDNIFLYDLECLLDDKNFYKDLSEKFEIYPYETDGDYFKFKSSKSLKYKLMYSNHPIRRSFIDNTLKISAADVFDDLDLNILSHMDVSYYQKIFDYCTECKSKNLTIFRENTQNIIFQSIWGIDLGMLYNPTVNLRIALEYLIDEKILDESIIEIISNNLKINLEELFGDENKIKEFIESLIINFLDENQFNHKFDLNDNLIQYYLTKFNLNSQLISNKINNNLLTIYPWLIKFKLTSESEDSFIQKINSEISELRMYYDKIFQDGIIDLNDLNDIFKLSKKFFTILYDIQSNDLKLADFNIGEFYPNILMIFKSLLSENIYQQLFNYPHDKKPFTVDKILDYINSNFKEDNIALIVMDGMSYDEWFILKEYLQSFKITEFEAFSILPSVTIFSRTAIFTGKTPKGFLREDFTTVNKAEQKGFINYFKEIGIEENDILFGHMDLNQNIVKNNNIKEELEFEYLKGYKKIGLICNLFDDEAHHINIFGENKSNLYKNISSAIESSNLLKILENLKENGYTIILTADHGNIYCESNGIKPNKNLEIDKISNRCSIYNSEVLADTLIKENPEECFKFNYNYLSKDLYLVFAVNGCFNNKTSITHGSFSPEECIVPVVILQ